MGSNGRKERVRIQKKDLTRMRHREVGGLLAAGVAHDLKNLQAVVRGYAEMIRDRSGDGQPRDFAENIIELATRGAEMLESILAFARGERGERTPHRVSDLIADFRRIMEPILTRRGITLTVEDGEALVVQVREGAILQVLCNLCFNSIEAIPKGGRITITVDGASLTVADRDGVGVSPGSYARIRFADTGHGMHPQTLARVFTPFSTTKRGARGKRKGTGLGCAVSRMIVREHGGDMTVESAPGSGTTFSLYLPLVEERKSARRRATIPVTASF